MPAWDGKKIQEALILVSIISLNVFLSQGPTAPSKFLLVSSILPQNMILSLNAKINLSSRI